MRSIVTVTTPAAETKLATVERVKLELSITDNSQDALIGLKLDEASSAIEALLGFTVARETVSELFWPEQGCGDVREAILLNRAPVASITSITVDDIEVDADEYRHDPDTGEVFRLDSTGFPSFWQASKSIVAVYAGGFLLPGEAGRTLPAAIENAAVSLLQSFWFWKGRDPLVKAEEVPGLGRFEYWVGGVGQAGELPPGVVSMLSRFRRVPL